MTDKPDVAELVERLRKLQSTAYGTVRMLQDKRKLVVNNRVIADTTSDTTIEFATALLQNAPVILDTLTTLSRRNAELEAVMERCAVIVERNLYRQHEKIEDVPKLLRAALGGSTDEA